MSLPLARACRSPGAALGHRRQLLHSPRSGLHRPQIGHASASTLELVSARHPELAELARSGEHRGLRQTGIERRHPTTHGCCELQVPCWSTPGLPTTRNAGRTATRHAHSCRTHWLRCTCASSVRSTPAGAARDLPPGRQSLLRDLCPAGARAASIPAPAMRACTSQLRPYCRWQTSCRCGRGPPPGPAPAKHRLCQAPCSGWPAVQAVRPQNVVVELCRSRTALLSDPQQADNEGRRGSPSRGANPLALR